MYIGTQTVNRLAIIGSLSNSDGDGYENVTWTVKSHCFKLYRAYSISFNSTNVGDLFWSWIPKKTIEVQEKKTEKESRFLVFTSSTKREIRHFHVVVVQWRQRNIQKSVMHVQSCCCANLSLFFYRSRCRRLRCCLSSLITCFHNVF